MNDTDNKKADDDNVCIDCSVLKNEEDRVKCQELVTELAKETIDLETFSIVLIDQITGDEGDKADKLLSVFCDPDKITSEQESGSKEGLIYAVKKK